MWHGNSARFVNVSTVRKSRHSPVKGAGPKGALLPSPGEEWGKELALLGANHSREFSPPDQGLLAHNMSQFNLPCMGQQTPNSIHVFQVMPKHLFFFFFPETSHTQIQTTFWHWSLTLFFLDPLDWHHVTPSDLNLHVRKCFFLSEGWCKYKFSICTMLKLQGHKKVGSWREHDGKYVRIVSGTMHSQKAISNALH